jgi:methylphosphotriester-DNA--protein-cysteine methyltransferase
MYFVSIYENRRMKSVEIVLRREEGGRGRMMEGVNLTKIYCKHICKYHNVSPCTAIICKYNY